MLNFQKISLLIFLLTQTCFAQLSPIEITIDRNGVLLNGKFYVAEGEGIFPTVILLHGFPGNESDVLGIGNKLAQSGFNTVTFNYSGTFQSQGEVSWDNAQMDIRAAFNFIHQSENISKYKIDTARIYLGGFCFGGGMALSYAASHPEISTVFSIAGNDHGEFMREYVRNPELRKVINDMFDNLAVPKGNVRFQAGTLPMEIAEAGIDKINPIYDLKKCAPLLAQKDLLLIGGWNDVQVSIEQIVLPLYRALQREKAKKLQIVAFQDDHWFKNSREELAQKVIEWIKAAPERKKF
jgi:esterase/lipase